LSPPCARFANNGRGRRGSSVLTFIELATRNAQMTDQLRFLGENHRNELFVISAAAAAPAHR
jgi:hypothetical protein